MTIHEPVTCDLLILSMLCFVCFLTAKGHQHSISSDVQPVHACIKFDEVCKSGNTLLWDLVQDDNVVSWD